MLIDPGLRKEFYLPVRQSGRAYVHVTRPTLIFTAERETSEPRSGWGRGGKVGIPNPTISSGSTVLYIQSYTYRTTEYTE
jgi:hypothetical protein